MTRLEFLKIFGCAVAAVAMPSASVAEAKPIKFMVRWKTNPKHASAGLKVEMKTFHVCDVDRSCLSSKISKIFSKLSADELACPLTPSEQIEIIHIVRTTNDILGHCMKMHAENPWINGNKMLIDGAWLEVDGEWTLDLLRSIDGCDPLFRMIARGKSV